MSPAESDPGGADGIDVDGRWSYMWAERRRPMIHPLRSPRGAVLTVDAPEDHPWHHALWSTIKFVDGDNFWEEIPPYGVLRHTAQPKVRAERGVTVIDGDLVWIRPDRETVAVTEHRTLTDVPLAGGCYAIEWHSRLAAPRDVLYDRTPFDGWGGYGGLTLRGSPRWRDTSLMLAGDTGHDRILGERGRWCAISGTVDAAASGTGEARAGVLLCDHPDNLRHPTPWYASTRADTYGDDWANFVNAAFLWDEPLPMEAGKVLSMRHLIVVNDGSWSSTDCESAWQRWADGDLVDGAKRADGSTDP